MRLICLRARASPSATGKALNTAADGQVARARTRGRPDGQRHRAAGGIIEITRDPEKIAESMPIGLKFRDSLPLASQKPIRPAGIKVKIDSNFKTGSTASTANRARTERTARGSRPRCRRGTVEHGFGATCGRQQWRPR